MDLLSFSAAYVNQYALALVRVLGAVSLNPLLGSSRVPVPARIGLGLFTAFVLFPPGQQGAADVAVGPLEMAGELLIGLLAGFAVALIFATIQFAGALINANIGFGLGGGLEAGAELGGAGIERFFSALALLLFVQINGHHLFLAGLHELFQTVPVGTVTFVPGTAERLIVMSGAVLVAGVKMALPVLAALLMADLGMAILARVAPQFNLFAVGFPAKVAIGLAAILASLPFILPRMAALFRALPAGMQMLVG